MHAEQTSDCGDRQHSLELLRVSKHFGAIQAVSDVSLSIYSGEVVGLMGDNGTGKTTLVNMIAGNFPPFGGEIFMEGKRAHFTNPLQVRKHGVEIVYQDLALCDHLSAAHNIFLGWEKKGGSDHSGFSTQRRCAVSPASYLKN